VAERAELVRIIGLFLIGGYAQSHFQLARALFPVF
jgi:hypothetical protein